VKTMARIAALFNRSGAGRDAERVVCALRVSSDVHGNGAPAGGRARLAFACATAASLIAMVAVLLTSIAPASASEGCPNEARREEQGAAGRALPDCRAYELVSLPYQPAPFFWRSSEGGVPPFQPTGQAEFEFGTPSGYIPQVQQGEQVALNGNAMLFGALEPNSEGDGINNNLSRRMPNGWIGENVEPPQSRHGFLCGVASYVGYTPNLEKVVFRDGWQEPEDIEGPQYLENCGHDEPRLVPGENEESANLFLRDTPTRSWQLVNTTKQLPGTQAHDPWFQAISADGSHVVFSSAAQLTPDAPYAGLRGGEPTEYCNEEFGDIYVSSGGTVHVLTVLPDGTPVRGTLAGARIWPRGCGNTPSQSAGFTHSVSPDGERILFYGGGGFKFTNNGAGKGFNAVNAPYIHGGLYRREHPAADQSALAHGGTLGAGTLAAGSPTVSALIAATGSATLAEGSHELTALSTKAGEFRVGQTLAGEGIPPATTITAVGSNKLTPSLTLSAAVEEGKSGTVVPIRATGPQPPFAVGQTLTGEGIPQGTTITAVGAGSLTLSAAATANQTATALEASSECTEAAKACTIQIDVPEGGSGSGGGQFQWANAATTKIFFTDEEKLTADSTAAPGNPDLYEYDLEKPAGQRLTDLTVNASEPADVLGFSGASEDGSYLYFAAQAALTGSQQNSKGDTALGPAQGNGTLSGVARGNGNLTSGSEVVTGLSVSSGEFHVGQEIEGEGIPANTTITHCSPSCAAPTELTLSNNATKSNTVELTGLGSTELTGVSATSGAFHEGMTISGTGIPAHTWITEVGSGTLTLSHHVTVNGTQALSATAANLYLRHAGATTFIANLSPEGGDPCDWTLFCLTSRVSQNGRFIAFNSFDKLTGYDNHPVQSQACKYFHSGRRIFAGSDLPCPEAFRYAAAAGAHGELTCASCNPSGAPPASEFGWAVIQQAGRHVGGTGSSVMQLSNAVSDNGEVYFETMEKLLPTDENKTWDVYAYDGGEGPSAQLHLISTGKSEQPSYFVNATPDGSNIFFLTAQSVLRSDTKTDYDVYDARVGGGFAEPLIPPCEAEGCHPAYLGALGSSSPGSASFEGKGNLTLPPQVKPKVKPKSKSVKCKKGFVERKVKKKIRCVRKPKGKARKSARHSRRAGR
jgi:hypothetical protein